MPKICGPVASKSERFSRAYLFELPESLTMYTVFDGLLKLDLEPWFVVQYVLSCYHPGTSCYSSMSAPDEAS
jgi:hypothetical protein